MRRSLLALTVGLFVVLGAPLGADDLIFARFSDYLDSLRVQTGIPGLTAAVVGKTDVQWAQAYGRQDLDRLVGMRVDTPMHADGLTEALTATLVLRCVEEARLSLDDRIGQFKNDVPDPALTLRQLLTHTSGSAQAPTYAFRPDRLDPLTAAVRACTGDSYRETLANLFDRLAMVDSVPGPDVLTLVPPAEGVLTSEFERYGRVLARLSVAYAVDANLRASATQFTATTLTPTAGVVTTVRDLAQFDLALKAGLLLRGDTVSASFRAPLNAAGTSLPHALGWFAQSYNGEPVVWQFGTGDNGSSSMFVMLPARNLTLILLANSTGLAKSFSLSSGDISLSPFARLFLQTFAR